MEKELLEQYPDICAEIGELTRRTRVARAAAAIPDGERPGGTTAALEAQREKLERQKAEIEAFVLGLPNARQRRIVTLRALEGMDWNQVAAIMRGNATPGNLRTAYCRILKSRRSASAGESRLDASRVLTGGNSK